jgi:altronate dehydratase small subunit
MQMSRRYIIVDKRDNVATAITDLGVGEKIRAGEKEIVIRQDIRYGHKFSLTGIAEGEYVVKYGEYIGRATEIIAPGEHVHVHNVEDIVDEVRKL